MKNVMTALKTTTTSKNNYKRFLFLFFSGVGPAWHSSPFSWHSLATPLLRPRVEGQAQVRRVHQDAVGL